MSNISVLSKSRPLLACALLCLVACSGGPAKDLTIEALPVVTPSLPNVPTIPPPPHPVQHGDQSYSIYGVRRRESQTMDHDVEVTGYIVAVYAPPECPRGHTCAPPAAPHMWIADTRGEAEHGKRLMIVGYAENQQAIDDAQRRPQRVEEGQLAIPTDFVVGAKVKVNGRFARISGSGFNASEGLVEYAGHQTLEAPPAS